MIYDSFCYCSRQCCYCFICLFVCLGQLVLKLLQMGRCLQSSGLVGLGQVRYLVLAVLLLLFNFGVQLLVYYLYTFCVDCSTIIYIHPYLIKLHLINFTPQLLIHSLNLRTNGYLLILIQINIFTQLIQNNSFRLIFRC